MAVKKNKAYWERRFILLKSAQEKKDLQFFESLSEEYKRASRRIENEIGKWYSRFADNNEISFAEAKKWLKADELDEFHWTVKDYIRIGKENAVNQQWIKELENASTKVHISRLEALRMQMQQQVELLFDKELKGIDKHLRGSYEDIYYHTAFEIQKGFNLGWNLHRFSADELTNIIGKPWTVDNRTFSSRIWNDRQTLVDTLHTELTQSIIRGTGPQEVVKAIRELIGSDTKKKATYKAGRLVMTESAFFSSAAQKKCFNDLDVEMFENVATLDGKTSEICQDIDNWDPIPMKDYQIGVTAPPFHVWCRTTTVPWFDDNYTKRAARGADGEVYYVDGNMKYAEWKEKFVI